MAPAKPPHPGLEGATLADAPAAGGVQVRDETGLTLGTLIAFMQYAVLFSQPVQELAQRFVDLQNAQAAAERVQELIETPVALVSTSPERDDTILVRDPFVD